MNKATALFSFLFGLLLPFFSFAQIVINEVSSATYDGFKDEDNSQEDWIEFYNTSPVGVNMQGYTISRNENGNTNSWTFPDIIIKGNSYLTVFCSKKDRTEWFDHWEVPVYPQVTWKYFVGNSEPPATWRNTNFNDASWSSGMGGIGYGDGDDSTVITPALSVYMRKSFTITDTSKIAIGALLIDYDDAFVAYLNNVEIARANIGVYGDHPAYNTDAYNEHEAQMYQNGNFSGGYYVFSSVIDSALKPGVNVFSIQTHNYSGGLNDLSSIPYFLIGVKDTAFTYYPLPVNIHLHTDFNLNSNGQVLTLKDTMGNIVDQQTIGEMELNHSRGRNPDGGINWCIFNTPSPDSTNTVSTCYTGYGAAPGIDLPAGFYNGTQQVSMTGSGNDIIHYTTNGSVPTIYSPAYSEPVAVADSKVIRARIFPNNPAILPGKVSTNTYFINDNPSLPVVSLSTNSENLFDWNSGIYVFGPNADTTTTPFFGSNFWQDWKRPGHIEFFDYNDQQAFELDAELRIQGNYSKLFPQRSFTVKAKDDYGGYPINYQLFPDKPITEFKSFNIRNAGSDWNICHIRDRLNQKNVQQLTHLDIMDGRPSILFLNGVYWGVYELREKQDKFYIANNNNVDKDKIDFLEFDGSVIEGSNKGFLDMVYYMYYNNMAVQANYDSARNMIDLENFVDYFVVETYINNIDWLGAYTNNIKFWRTNDPVGKWRYMLWDTDLSLGRSKEQGADTTNMLARAINPETINPHSILLKSLLDNVGFKYYFVDRYCDLMNTIYRPYKFKQKADELHDEMLPEMARHFELWGNFDSLPQPFPLYYTLAGFAPDVPTWEYNIDTMEQYMDSRPFHAFNQLQNQFQLAQQVAVTLDVYPEGAGTIKLNTIYPDSLPWTGTYMDGVPVVMTATANPGYIFSHWQSPVLVPDPYQNVSLGLNVTQDETFTAYFEPDESGIDVYPNPFTDNFTLFYQLPADAEVSIKMYSITGQQVAELVSDNKVSAAGINEVMMQGSKYSLANGVYYINYTAKGFSKIVRVVKTEN